jgi:SOS-response transcriptional repressor LexA
MQEKPCPTSTGLTPRQRECLDAIEAHLAQTRTMPSVEELRVTLRSGSKAGILRLLRQLEERGRIERLPNRARAIRLLHGDCCPQCGALLEKAAA